MNILSLIESSPIASVNMFDVDLGAIAHNAAQIRLHVGAGKFICAALKSNAYGFGLIEVAKTVTAAGADGLAVVSLGDAIRLRESGISCPIILYAGAAADESVARVVEELNLMPTILDLATAHVFSVSATRPIKYMIKVDVGLQRIGLEPSEVVSFAHALSELPHLQLHGLYTHMHVPPDPQTDNYLEWQFKRFTRAVADMESSGINVPIKMAASSAVLARMTKMNLNAVDPGRLFYGLLPTKPAFDNARFRSAFRQLTSRLVQVKSATRPDFEHLSPFPVRPSMRIGIFPLGRSDGMLVLASDHVLIRGHKAPILARPSLEHTRVDLTNIPDSAVGDEVVIVGSQGEHEITPDDIASRTNIDAAEIAIGVRGSIMRRYFGRCDAANRDLADGGPAAT